MRKDMPNKTSPSSEAIEHSTPAVSISKINNLFKPSSSTSTNKSASSHYNSNSIGKSSTGKEVLKKNKINAKNSLHFMHSSQMREEKKCQLPFLFLMF